MEDLKALLHKLAAAVHRPADHPQEDLDAAIDALDGAAETEPVATDPPPPDQPSDPDVQDHGQPAQPVEPFGSESDPGSSG